MSTIQRRQIQYTLSHKIESPSVYSRKDELELQSHLKLIAGYSITERNLNKTCCVLRDEVRNLRRFRNRPVDVEVKLSRHDLNRQNLPRLEVVTSVQYISSACKRDFLKAEMRGAVRKYRILRKQVHIIYRAFHGKEYSLVGGVHLESKSLLGLMKDLKFRKINQNKKPKTSDRHVGIELEFLSSFCEQKVKEYFIEAGLEDYVTYHEDGSVNANSEDSECQGECHADCEGAECDGCCDPDVCNDIKGHEVCVLVRELNYRSIIRKVCKVLARLQATVNHTCGMHVHIDMRNRDVHKAYTNLVHALPVLTALVPKTRLTNSYCKDNEHVSFSDQVECGDRYRMVNAMSHGEHTTLEVRLHSGTANPVKIVNWITLLLRVTNAKPLETPVHTIPQLQKYARIAKPLAKYMRTRAKHFGKQDWDESVDDQQVLQAA